MLLALRIALAAAATSGVQRSVVIDGKPLVVPVSAQVAEVPLPVSLLVSSEERTILATLLHRAWTPRDANAVAAYPEPSVLLDGRAPDLELEHAGVRIDERLRLLLWRRPERLRGLPLWGAVGAQQGGGRAVLPPVE